MKVKIWPDGSTTWIEPCDSDVFRYGEPLPVEIPAELYERFVTTRDAYRDAVRSIVDEYGYSLPECSAESLARLEQEHAEFRAEWRRDEVRTMWARINQAHDVMNALFTTDAERDEFMTEKFGEGWQDDLLVDDGCRSTS